MLMILKGRKRIGWAMNISTKILQIFVLSGRELGKKWIFFLSFLTHYSCRLPAHTLSQSYSLHKHQIKLWIFFLIQFSTLKLETHYSHLNHRGNSIFSTHLAQIQIYTNGTYHCIDLSVSLKWHGWIFLDRWK